MGTLTPSVPAAAGFPAQSWKAGSTSGRQAPDANFATLEVAGLIASANVQGVDAKGTTSVTVVDIPITKKTTRELRIGAAPAADAAGVSHLIRGQEGGAVSAGTTGKAGGVVGLLGGAGSAAKAASAADGGAGGDLQVGGGAGGAGDGAGNAGVAGCIDVLNPIDGAGAGAGTLANAPVAGDPAKWLKVKIAGVVHFIPAWASP